MENDMIRTKKGKGRACLRRLLAVLAFVAAVQQTAQACQDVDSEILHYWDSLPMEAYVAQDRVEELIPLVIDEMPAFVEFLSKEKSPLHAARTYVSVMTRAEDAGAEPLWHCLRDMAEDYFHGANSAFRNDEIYIPIAEAFVKSAYVGESDSIRYAFQIEMMKKNRVGTVATDINLRIDGVSDEDTGMPEYCKAGRKVRLSELCADSTLVLFYDPMCEHCRQQIVALMVEESGKNLCKDGNGRVIAVNVEPKNRMSKRKIRNLCKEAGTSCVPEGWVFATDYKCAVIRRQAYYLPFVPRIYLLGKNMEVLDKEL